MGFKTEVTEIKLRPGFLFLCCGILLFCGMDTAISMLFAAVIHEMAHIAAAGFFGGRLGAIEFGYSGITMKAVYPRITSYFCDGVCALAGPAVNLVTGICAAMFFGGDIAFIFAGTNILFGIYNLIPAFGLDGGIVLESFLKKVLPLGIAERVMIGFAAVFASTVTVIGVYVLIVAGNLTLLVFGAGLMAKVIKYRRTYALTC